MNPSYQESRRKWFSRLTADHDHGLLKNINPPSDSIIICNHLPPLDDNPASKNIHSFAMFSPLYTFAKELVKVSPEERCFFEVILGNRPQKPYFDIDIDKKEYNITEKEALDLINHISMAILTDQRINSKDILIFTSHGSSKFSYHIIVNNWCLPDQESNKSYCLGVISKVPDIHPLKKMYRYSSLHTRKAT